MRCARWISKRTKDLIEPSNRPASQDLSSLISSLVDRAPKVETFHSLPTVLTQEIDQELTWHHICLTFLDQLSSRLGKLILLQPRKGPQPIDQPPGLSARNQELRSRILRSRLQQWMWEVHLVSRAAQTSMVWRRSSIVFSLETSCSLKWLSLPPAASCHIPWTSHCHSANHATDWI